MDKLLLKSGEFGEMLFLKVSNHFPDPDLGANEGVHAQSRDREHGRRGEVNPDQQLVPQVP